MSSVVAWLVLVCFAAPVPAAAPVLNALSPAGAQRGTTVEVTAVGTFGQWPVRVWCDGKGLDVQPHKDKGKLTITIAADAVPGVYWLRLADDQGATALRPFIIGTLPEVAEKEPNDDYRKAQPLDKSCVVNGRLDKAGDVDCYSIKLTKGQTLVASLDANRTLGSPLDGVLQIVAAAGNVVAENNDYHDLDPQIAYTAKDDGTYVVRVFAFPAAPDSTIGFAGGELFIYRLTVTTGPFVEHAFPLAVERSKPGEVELIGWNIPEAARKVKVPVGDSAEVTAFHAQAANAVQVRLEPHPTAVKTKGDAKEPQTLALPMTVSGIVDLARTPDRYQFEAKKGKKVVFQLESRSLGFALSGVLRLTDASGKVLARAEEGASDVALAFTPTADGTYRIEVSDLNGEAGPRYAYRLRALPVQPDYQLTLATDRFTLAAGKTLEIPVTIERREGFAGDIEISVEGLPTGMTAIPVKAKPADKTATLRLTAEAKAASGSIRIVGKVDGSAELTRTASSALPALKTATPHFWLTAVPAKS